MNQFMNTILETHPILLLVARRKAVRYGWESLSYLGPRLWNILPDEYKKIQSVKDIKLRSDYGCLKTALVGCVKYIFNMWGLFRDFRQI